MSNRNSAVQISEAVLPTTAGDHEVVKRDWQAPTVSRVALSETANATGTGPDGGTFS
jgi:hypothetical protein